MIKPYLDGEVSLVQVIKQHGLALRTARRWVQQYREHGLAGLSRKLYEGKGRARMSAELRQAIEGMALQKPRLSVAAIHRKTAAVARRLGEPAPSYSTVYLVVSTLPASLVTLAHEGSKAYGDAFDLVHRTEAEAPNAIWQADHTQLDILVKDEAGQARLPWLTVVLDDYSRAVAGFLLSFHAPSAMQTALALRQAIWRKPQAGWHVCGIPQVLYTDHGSDFTSQHIEQVAANLKIRLIFSAVGKPRGRGKIERFFESLSQVLLMRLPGYAKSGSGRKAVLTLPELSREIENYLLDEYFVTPHRTTSDAPQARWEGRGFLPQMPESLEQLDLLLLTVPKTRRVRVDGIHFMGMRYIDPTLAAYVGEEVLLRYDPRDVAEIRLFYRDKFLCRAICQELAGETVPLREIVSARDRQRRELRQTIEERRRKVDSLLEARRFSSPAPPPEPSPPEPKIRLKRYHHD